MAPGSRSVVYAVNTLHVARDLYFTLGEIRAALAPGGRLIFSECVRMQPGQPLNGEFIFNLMATFRSQRPDTPGQPPAGFLLPDQWKATLEAAGFTDVRFLPDVLDAQRALPPLPRRRHRRDTPVAHPGGIVFPHSSRADVSPEDGERSRTARAWLR